MTIILELPPELEARFIAEARAAGVPVNELLKAYLHNARSLPSPRQLSADELNQALEEASDLLPVGLPVLSDEAISRESIYTREDDWNR